MSGPNLTPEQSKTVDTLKLVAELINQLKFPSLTRPHVLPNEPPTLELVEWGIKRYSFPWLRHFGKLAGGMITLNDAGNLASVRIVGRSSYELCAHVYYVKKHIKQYLDAKDLAAAWNFLLPITTGSRYINELHPEDAELFPAGAHISKAIKVFQQELMPKISEDDDYSYLSEFCHPNMMTFSQHYRWVNPQTIEFGNAEHFGAFGAITGSAIQGLLVIHELLGVAQETDTRRALTALLKEILEQSK
jgi:hypothetical protein